MARALSKGEPASNAKTKRYVLKEKSKMFLPMGPNVGVSYIGAWTYGSVKTAKWKGKDLFSAFPVFALHRPLSALQDLSTLHNLGCQAFCIPVFRFELEH